MKRSTRTSRAAVLLTVCLALAVPARAAGLPVVVEVFSDPGVPGEGVPPGVLEEARRRAVGTVLNRHLEGPDRNRAAAALGRSSRYVQRLSVLSDRVEADRRVTAVEAVVDRDRLLGELAGFGIEAARLGVEPRVLLATAPGPGAAPLAREFTDLLERERRGFRAAPGVATAGEAIEAARTLGCHVVLYARVEAEVEGEPEGPFAATGDGEPAGTRATATARGWVLDAVGGEPLGEAQAEAEGAGPDGVEAEARAAARAGRRLGEALLGVLERSGWALPGDPEPLRIRVRGIPSPGALEALDRALAGLAEVEEARLAEVAWREGVWEVRARSGGFPWDVVLSWVVPPGGGVRVEAREPGEIRCAWRATAR